MSQSKLQQGLDLMSRISSPKEIAVMVDSFRGVFEQQKEVRDRFAEFQKDLDLLIVTSDYTVQV